MMVKINQKNSEGFTLIEVIVAVFVFVIVFTGVLSMVLSSLKLVSQSRSKTLAIAIANQELEKARNFSYSLVGIIDGFPSGSFASTSQITQNGSVFYIERNVAYVVDEADGVASPDDECPNDYKRISIRVRWQGKYAGEVNFSTDIMPETLAEECAVVGGVLSVSVFDDHGTMINSPTIEIRNSQTGTSVSTANPVSGQHYFSLPAGEYKIIVSKNDYSTEQTFGSNELYNGENVISPEKANPIIIDKKLISQSFSIDLLGSLSLKTTGLASMDYPVVAGASILVNGSKKVGTDAEGKAIYKYSQSNTTGGTGVLSLSNMESDLYSFSSNAGNLNIVATESPFGTPVIQPIGLNPAETKQIRIILQAQDSLLVTVKNSTTQLPVFSSLVRVYNDGLTYDQALHTDELGRAYFIPMQAGNYFIDVSAAGYISLPGTEFSVSGSSTKIINIVQEE